MKRRRLTGSTILVGLSAVLILTQLHLLAVRVYDPDEFEHVRAGFLMSIGQQPYRDFFEHHGPVTYALSAPLIRLIGATPIVLDVHRLVSWVLLGATCAGTWTLASRLFGRRGAALAVVLLLTHPNFIEKSVEWRPDCIATCLVVWSACWIVRRGSAPANALVAGMLAALAVATTQKTVFLAAGLAVAGVMTFLARRDRPMLAMLTGASGAGGVFAGIIGILGTLGIATDAWQCLVVVPMTWTTRVTGGDYLLGMTSFAPGHQALGAVSLVLLVTCGLGPVGRRRGRGVLLVPLLLHAGGVILVPAVYFQYFQLAMPIAAVLAGGATVRALGRRRQGRSWTTVLIPLLAALWTLAGLVIRDRAEPTPYQVLDSGSAIAMLVLVPLVGMPRRNWLPKMVMAIALLPAVGRIAIMHAYWPNGQQRAVLSWVDRAVPPTEAVLDGFTGLGCLRPQVGYFGWLNEHTLPMAYNREPVGELLARTKPGLVVIDAYLMRTEIESVIVESHEYIPVSGATSMPARMYLRWDLVAKAGP